MKAPGLPCLGSESGLKNIWMEDFQQFFKLKNMVENQGKSFLYCFLENNMDASMELQGTELNWNEILLCLIPIFNRIIL